MHEMAITRGVLSIALDEAKRHNAKKINSIELLIGEYSGVVPSCVQEFFKIAARDTLAEDAVLCIRKSPAKIRCNACAFEGATTPHYALCPKCGGEDIKIISGMEYMVSSIEVE